MAKFSGKLGYAIDREESPGTWYEDVLERPIFGDFVKNIAAISPGENVNSGITLQNAISIVADPFVREHYSAIRYVFWAGGYWSVTNVEIDYPRLILRLGGVYNGAKAPGAP